ncbi:MAG: hypothetical protein QOH81_939 [Sphingomonadales bacterium]|jgi:hypothetical protein|nr:hypothetical protein [Sphingomonadales bacterium]
MDHLARAISQVRDRSSLYWGFYDRDIVVGGEEPVEVRLNASPEQVRRFESPPEWRLHRVQWGEVIYLRRHQHLTEGAVEEMLIAMLRLAAGRGFRFHSWIHGSDLD